MGSYIQTHTKKAAETEMEQKKCSGIIKALGSASQKEAKEPFSTAQVGKSRAKKDFMVKKQNKAKHGGKNMFLKHKERKKKNSKYYEKLSRFMLVIRKRFLPAEEARLEVEDYRMK